MCLKKCLFFYNLYQFEPMFINFGTRHPEDISLLACIISHLTLVVLLHYLRIH